MCIHCGQNNCFDKCGCNDEQLLQCPQCGSLWTQDEIDGQFCEKCDIDDDLEDEILDEIERIVEKDD